MSYKYTFTVFTPTFNRAHTLHRVYGSLKAQTFRDFEWLIVDDGSNDNTKVLVEKWQMEASFPIRYTYQENQGKHVAFNRGVQLAQGELFLTLDSDDSCVPEALERFKYHWDNIPINERIKFSAVTALCKDQFDNIVGNKFPMDITDSDYLEISYKYKVKGEKWGFHRTDILKQFPFPILENIKFIPEGIVWSAIARKYKTRFVNEMLRIYWSDETGNADQLMKSGPSRHALGHALWHQSILNNEIDWFLFSPLRFFRSAVHYSRFSFHVGIGLRAQTKQLHLPARLLWFLCLPFGAIKYMMEKDKVH